MLAVRLCIGGCPFNAIKVEDKKAVILDNCTLCGACVSSCKFKAIDFQKDEVPVLSILSSIKESGSLVNKKMEFLPVLHLNCLVKAESWLTT